MAGKRFDESYVYGGQHLRDTKINNMIDAIAALEKNRSEATTAESYSALCAEMNASSKISVKFILGRSIYVRTENVPDVWIYRIEDTPVSYTYTTDEAFITALRAGNLQVGYFLLAPLETEKPQLSIYQEKSIIEYDTTNDSAAITLDAAFTNHELRYTNAVDSIIIQYDSAILEDAAFIADLVFKTKKDTTITFQEIPTVDLVNIKYLGTDTSEGVFYPEAGVIYDMTFYFDGISLKCLVSGVAY